MTTGTTVKISGFDNVTTKLIISCALFTYLIGIVARVSSFEDTTVAILLSLSIDTLIVVANVFFIKIIMRSKFFQVNITSFLVILVASVACSFVVVGVIALARKTFPSIAPPIQLQPIIVIYYTFIFCIWGMAACWINMQIRATDEAINMANAERAVAVSELRRLRMQLDPHFLFNALNTALVEVNQQPKRAVRMLRELSSYLRYSLDTADVLFVPVAAELAMIRSFLRVQDIRFGAKLKYTIVAEEGTKRRLIPTFLLLPLIENAAKYGIPDDDNILHVDVTVALRDGDLVMTVANTGDLALAGAGPSGTRTGLSNLQARLALHYPGRHSFEMIQAGQNVCVTCILTGEPC